VTMDYKSAVAEIRGPPADFGSNFPVAWVGPSRKRLDVARGPIDTSCVTRYDSSIKMIESRQQRDKTSKRTVEALSLMAQETSDAIGVLDHGINRVRKELDLATKERTSLLAQIERNQHSACWFKQCCQRREERPQRENVQDVVSIALQQQKQELKISSDAYERQKQALDRELNGLRKNDQQLQQQVDTKLASLRVDVETLHMRPEDQATSQLGHSSSTAEVLPPYWHLDTEDCAELAATSTLKCERERIQSWKLRPQRVQIDRRCRNESIAALHSKLSATGELIMGLERRLMQVDHELAGVENSIQFVQREIEDNKPALQLAKTRLRNRSSRPATERKRDIAEGALEAEVGRIALSTKQLEAQLHQLKLRKEELQTIRDDLQADLEDKRAGYAIDTECLELQESIRISARSAPEAGPVNTPRALSANSQSVAPTARKGNRTPRDVHMHATRHPNAMPGSLTPGVFAESPRPRQSRSLKY